MEEQWRPAVYSRFPEIVKDLEVSNLGSVRKIVSKKVFKQNDHKDGYLCIKRQGKTLYYHTFVAETWLGARPEGHSIDHIDNDKSNNKASNLRYVTIAHNSAKQDRVETTNEQGEVVFKAVRHWKENFIRSADRMKREIEELKKQNEVYAQKFMELYGAVNAIGLMTENHSRLLSQSLPQTNRQTEH